jgi:hypothetical protein
MRIGRDMGASAKHDVPARFDSVTVGRLYVMWASMSRGNKACALCVAVLLAVGLGAPASRAQTPPALTEYAVLGVAGVRIGRESRVLSGAVGSVGGTVRLGPKARVSSVVAAPTVRLGLAAHTGPLFCHLVSGPPTLPTCDAFGDPLVDPALLAPVPIVPGSTDLRVPAHTGTAPIPPGTFRDVRVGAGGLLQLYGGVYAARSLRIGRGARVVCESDCRIGVEGHVRLGGGAGLGSSTPTRADTARVDVAASGPGAFIARPRANLSATVFAPAGDVIVGRLGSYRGALVGHTVVVGAHVTIRGNSAL